MNGNITLPRPTGYAVSLRLGALCLALALCWQPAFGQEPPRRYYVSLQGDNSTGESWDTAGAAPTANASATTTATFHLMTHLPWIRVPAAHDSLSCASPPRGSTRRGHDRNILAN